MKKVKNKRPLKIKSISYARLKNLGNYQNERVEVTVDVSCGETPEIALKRAKQWVLTTLAEKKSKAPSHNSACICDECMDSYDLSD